MVTFFRKSKNQAVEEQPSIKVDPSSSLPDEQTTMTSTLLDTQAFPSNNAIINDAKQSRHHHERTASDADKQSFHSLEGVDSRKLGTVGSPMSDVKPLQDHEVTDAVTLGDGTKEKAAATVQEEDDSDRGYLHGVQLWLVYASMLLCIFLVSLDFTIV